MTIISHHLMIAYRDPLRYSEVPAPAQSCLRKVPLDMMEASSEISDFAVRDKNSDNALCKSEISGFGLRSTNCDKTSCMSEITAFALEPVE